MALTQKEKNDKITNELNAIAVKLGFETWNKFSTEARRADACGMLVASRDGQGNQFVTLRFCAFPNVEYRPPPHPADAQAGGEL